MTQHYYTPNPDAAHDERSIHFEVLGQRLSCTTDAGTFSRDGLDTGTRILLESLPELHGRVLDLGCGWGAVGVALGRKYSHLELVLSDINARAAALAERNLRRNGVSNARVVQGDGYENVAGNFDAIVLNPPIRTGKEVIYGLFAGAARRLREGGALYIVIRKQQGAESAQRYLSTQFGHVERIARERGYWVLCCRQPLEAAETPSAGAPGSIEN